VSILVSTAEQNAVILQGLIGILAERDKLDWEICICDRSPEEPTMAHAVERLRGTQPWIRIVSTDDPVDDATAVRWTVEQATGEFVALLAPGYAPESGAISRLLARLQSDPGMDAAVLVGTETPPGSSASSAPWVSCRLLLQRKSRYLAAAGGCWVLTAPVVAKDLAEAGAPTAYIRAD
jgi:hypothetical protein